MTDKEKIFNIIREFNVRKRRYSTYTEPNDDEELADALLANGIGDVAEWKAKYEKMSLVTKLYTNACTTEIERLTKERDGLKHRAELWEKHCKDWETLVKERERMAEVAERIAREACKIVFSQEIDEEDWENVIYLYKEENEKYCDEIGITEDMLYDYLKEQAEREIAEENNGKK